MHIYSLSFLFFLLPVAVLLYYAVGRRYKVLALLVISLYFAATVSTTGLLIMLGSVLIDYWLSKPVYIYGRGTLRGKVFLFICAAKNILIFVALSSLSQLSGGSMPLGVLVYCFTSLGYVIDLYYGECEPAPSFYEFALFCCFFGKLYVGPIVSYQQFSAQLRGNAPSMTKISQGIMWFLHGLAKKVVIADPITVLYEQFRSIPSGDKTVLSVWMLVVCGMFSVYFTLSAFSDMARGLGAIFGLDLPENFHYPLQADSVTDFFSRFNMSANRFVRKYVYQALGAEDNGRLSTTLNILLITMLMGLWYGIRLNYLVWGVFLGLFIVLETLFEDFWQRVHPFFRRLYTFVAILLSFAWYCSFSLSQAGFYLQTMLGLRSVPLFEGLLNTQHAAFANPQCMYLIQSNWLLLLLSAVLCTNTVSYLGHQLTARYKRASAVGGLLIHLALAGVIIVYLV